jgi:hypothetical protein
VKEEVCGGFRQQDVNKENRNVQLDYLSCPLFEIDMLLQADWMLTSSRFVSYCGDFE